MNALEFSMHGRRWRVDLARAADLAIPLDFAGPQPRFFATEPASATALRVESFSGSVAHGASCNCATYTLSPHCHGTHTECVGHLTREPASLAARTPVAPMLALVVTVAPVALGPPPAGVRADPADSVISRDALEAAVQAWLAVPWSALVVRTLPNESAKRHRSYDGRCPAPYFTAEAMRWIVERDVVALVCDLPSLDRADDGGQLVAHRLFWGLPPGAADARQATRGHALVTELAYVPPEVQDGLHLLDLQVPAFVADAAPSRPVLYPAVEVAAA